MKRLDSEMCALVKAVQYFQIYLAGTRFVVRLMTVYLRYWNTMNVPARQYTCQMACDFSFFRFAIEHKAGVTNTIADTLSRYPVAVPNTQLKPVRNAICVPRNSFAFAGSMSDHYDEVDKSIIDHSSPATRLTRPLSVWFARTARNGFEILAAWLFVTACCMCAIAPSRWYCTYQFQLETRS